MIGKTKEQLQTERDEWKKHANDVSKLNAELNQKCDEFSASIREKTALNAELNEVIQDLKVNLLETQRRESTLKTEKENLEGKLKDHKRELENQDANLRQAKRAVNAQNAVIESQKAVIEGRQTKDSNSMKSFETPEVIQELLKTISKQRKKAKKYKRMYQDARKANFKLQQML